MPGSERKTAAKEVDAVFSTAAVAETRGGGGDGGERRQRATGVGDNRVDGRLGSGDGGSVRARRDSGGRWQLPGHGSSRERRRRRRMRLTMLAWTQGRRRRRVCQETGKEGGGGSASAASRRKQRRRPRSMAATASWEAGTGGLMKTETRPTATEKSEGREDPHVVGDGKEEEGERETAAATKFAEDPATASRRRKAVGYVCGDGREGREGDGRRWRKREEREKRQGGSPVEERESREEKPGLTARRGRSGGRRQRSASKNGDAGARRDNGGMAHHLLIECHPCELNSELLKLH